ncbi:site-specific integrase [Microbacterium immunditiarum]|uniref:Integrase n=1 Tax=Microbacterium immunditiarum TaxID=337480 RepID=A0A7Y9GK82_9MICO|nr:site-specific integrase [Microbacterium immunditiarum]NYE18061.1 integrase [Microbacterium immunditiarum]
MSRALIDTLSQEVIEMGSVQPYRTRSGKRYEVRYKKPDGTHAGKRGFATKREAEDYLADVTVSINDNQYIDPGDARITVGELAQDWLLDQATVLKPSSFHPIESAWRNHVEPRWATFQIGAVRYSDVRSWVTELAADVGAVTVIRSHGILSAILDVAVRDRRIAENSVRGMRLPRKRAKRRVYLTHGQVERLAATSKYPEVVYFLAYTGLRWGEMTGLRVRDLNLTRRRVFVQENAVMVNGTVHIGSPKSHASRSVPYPEFLDDVLRASAVRKAPDAFLFGTGGAPLKLPNSRDGWFAAAVRRAMKEDPLFQRVTPHDMRHTAASLAISAGANVKVVQRMLGHASAAMTLDIYADLFDEDLDDVAGALGRARQDVYVLTESAGPKAQAAITASPDAVRIVWVVTVGPIPVAACENRAGADAWVRAARSTDHSDAPASYRVWELSIAPDELPSQ